MMTFCVGTKLVGNSDTFECRRWSGDYFNGRDPEKETRE